MKKLFKKILLNKIVLEFFIKLFIKLHNYSYKVLSVLVVFEGKGIHPKHDIMKYHNFFIDNVSESDAVVDIGCGNGYLTYDIARKAKKVVGIDIIESNISKAKKRYNKENIDYMVGDATTFGFEKKFDKIVLSNVLEHIKDRIVFLKSLHNLSNKILLRVPMIDRDWLVLYKKEKGFDHRLDDTHFIEYTVDILNKELKESGWKLVEYSVQFGELWCKVIR